jgi:hypothetical protein
VTNAVPPVLTRAVNRILTDQAAKGWRDGCTELALRFPRYLTVLRGGKLSDQPNLYHILGAVLKCGFPEVTDDNWREVLAAIGQRARPLHEAENVLD